MKLATIAAASSLMGLQIQRSFHKLGFKITGAKAAGVSASVQLIADAKQVYVSLKRVSSQIGEKVLWPRMSLYELINAACTVEGFVYTTGLDADAAYTGEFYMELNTDAAILVTGGDYLELNIENAVAGFGADVIGLGNKIANHNHLRIERTALQPNEFKTIPCVLDGTAAFRVLVPNGIADGRVNGPNPYSLDSTDVNGWVLEKSSLIFNKDGGKTIRADYAAIDSDVDLAGNNHIASVDITNGANAGSILVLREVFYNLK